MRELADHVLLEHGQRIAGELPWRNVDLKVEPAKLAGPVRIGNGLQHRHVRHGRHAVRVDQVYLDLKANLTGLSVKPGLAKHPGKDVKALADLLPVGAAIVLTNSDGRDIPAHN